MLSSVVLKRSTSDDVEGVPCGTSEIFRKYASSRLTSTAFLEAHRARAKLKRSAGGVNARRPCGTHGRSAAESVDAAEHRFIIDLRWRMNLRTTRRRDVRSDRRRHHRVICSEDPSRSRDESRAVLW